MNILIFQSPFTSKVSKFLQVYPDESLLSLQITNSTDKLLNTLSSYCSSNSNELLTIILGIDEHALLKKIEKIIKRESLLRTPKLIILSNYNTWSGKTYSSPLTDLNFEFLQRKPNCSSVDIYLLENCLWQTAFKHKIELYMVGVGIIYGTGGCDLELLMDCIFDKKSISLPFTESNKNNIVPMIHAQDLTQIIYHLIKRSPIAFEPSFIACCDCNGDSTDIVLSAFTSNINGTPSTLTFLTTEETTESYLNIDALSPTWSWDLNINFAPSTSILETPLKTLSKDYSEIWLEYSTFHKLDPCNLMICGGPKSGKSEIAKEISNQLRVPLVDVITAVKYVLNASQDNDGNDDTLVSLKSEIVSAIEAKLMESNKKPKKGEEIKPGSLDIAGLDVTFELCTGALSPQQLRRALGYYITKSRDCKRSGYVLDIWEYSSLMLPSLEDASSLFQYTNESEIISAFPELIVEINVKDAVVVKRRMAALGVPDSTVGVKSGGAALSKEAQAAVKALEGALTIYSQGLVPVESIDGGEEEAGPAYRSHVIVLEMEGDDKYGGGSDSGVLRLNGELTVGELATQLISMFKGIHGNIGWLRDDNVAADTAEEVKELIPYVKLEDEKEPTITDGNKTVELIGYDAINNNIKNLKDEEKEFLFKSCDELQEYLVANILPQITQVMVEIARNRPEDPIAYMAGRLKMQADEVQSAAETEAHTNFYKILAQAEADFH